MRCYMKDISYQKQVEKFLMTIFLNHLQKSTDIRLVEDYVFVYTEVCVLRIKYDTHETSFEFNVLCGDKKIYFKIEFFLYTSASLLYAYSAKKGSEIKNMVNTHLMTMLIGWSNNVYQKTKNSMAA